MSQESQHLLTVISEQEAEIRQLKHQLARSEAMATKRELQNRTLNTLNLSLFNVLEPEQVYALVSESLVYQLSWDTGWVVTLHERRAVIVASFQATQKQIGHVQDYLGQDLTFTDAYSHRQAISTLSSKEPAALSLRVLFQSDEVVAMPIQFGDQLYGYLIAAAHTKSGRKHTHEDVDFLATLATLVGHAVQNSRSFKSLEEQNARLRHLDELKNSFISITSHQLRTPLSIIKWVLATLQSDTTLAPHQEQVKMIGQAYETNERLIHVVNDLLNVSRIEDGRLPYNPQLTDLRSLLENLTSGMENICAQQDISLTSELAADLPALELDPILFREAVQNLLDNAVDYNQPKGIITVKASLQEDGILVSVTNSGAGIPAEELGKIFDQFYRSPQAVRTKPNGNGLGLYLTRAIVQEHGGKVLCESKEGQETTFSILLKRPTS